MTARRLRVLFSAILVLMLSQCRQDERQTNIVPIKRYASLLLVRSRTDATIESCDMFGPTRRGFCLVKGNRNQLKLFVHSMGLKKKSPELIFHEGCLEMATFGIQMSGGRNLQKSTVDGFVPNGPMPPNSDNVYFDIMYINKSSQLACLEFHYPYG